MLQRIMNMGFHSPAGNIHFYGNFFIVQAFVPAHHKYITTFCRQTFDRLDDFLLQLAGDINVGVENQILIGKFDQFLNRFSQLFYASENSGHCSLPKKRNNF